MVAHTEMAPPPLGEAEAGDKEGDPPQGANAIDLLTRLHPAEAEPAARADAARPGSDDHRIGPDQLPAGGERRIDVDRLEVAAEGMPAGNRAVKQPSLLQPRDAAAEGQRQGGSIGHDIGDPAGRAVIFQHRRGRSDHAVQFADEHGHPCQIPEPAQAGAVTRRALLAAEHPHLPGRIAELHDMALSFKGRYGPAEVELDKMKASATERQIERGGIQQDQIAATRRPRKPIVIQGPLCSAPHIYTQLAARSRPGEHRADPADAVTDHLPTTFLNSSPPRRIILAGIGPFPSPPLTISLSKASELIETA